MPTTSRRGRRPAGEDTRGLILDAARAEFAERGFDAASQRAVARRAGVDPALVRHYFGSKAELFAASLVPGGLDARVTVAAMVDAPPDVWGERLVRTALGLWDSPEGRARLRSVLSGTLSADPEAAIFFDYVRWNVFGGLESALAARGVDDAAHRVSLAVAQVLGVLVARVVLGLEPVASLDGEALVADVAPVVQRYLTDPLPSLAADARGQGSRAGGSRDLGALASGPPADDYSSHGE